MGRASALGMAGESAGGVAGSVPGAWLDVSGPTLSRVICLNIWVSWLYCHGRGAGVFGCFCTRQYSSGCHSDGTPCHEPGTCLGWE